MMRSLYSGVSGLQNHQVRMDVLGNNIANVNTIGFKKGRVNFQDLISQSMQGAARPTEELGGVNPKQVGLGMNIASIDTIHTQGSLQTTGVMTDLSLQGDGFGILRSGDKHLYTRAGAFGLDEEGILVNPANGMRVQGWSAQTLEGVSYINTSDSVGDLVIPVGGKDPAVQTREVYLACNLDKRTAEIPEGAGPRAAQEGTWSTSFDIFDSFGNIHTLRVDFSRRTGEPNRWNAAVTIDPESEGTNTLVDLGAGGNNNANTFVVEFGNLGTLTAAEDGAGDLRPEPGRGGEREEHGDPVRRKKLHQGLHAGRLRHGVSGRLQDRPVRGHHRGLFQRQQPGAGSGRAGGFRQSRRAGKDGGEHLCGDQQLRRSQHRRLRGGG